MRKKNSIKSQMDKALVSEEQIQRKLSELWQQIGEKAKKIVESDIKNAIKSSRFSANNSK